MGAALGVLVATLLVVVSVAEPASALPAVCDSGSPNVRVWDHDSDTVEDFDNTGLWAPAGVPGSNPNEILCIATSDKLVLDSAGATSLVHVDEIYLDGSAELEVKDGAGLFVDGSTESVLGVRHQRCPQQRG